MTRMMRFARDETGAVTVDWVVLGAVLVGLGFAIITVVAGSVEDYSGETQATLVTFNPVDNPFDGDNTAGQDSID